MSNQTLEANTILKSLRTCAKSAKLKPKVHLDDEAHEYQDKSLGYFYGIHFYWDEYYFDKLQVEETKINHLIKLVEEEIPKLLPKATKTQWGTSDGHLFVYINLPEYLKLKI